MEFSQGDLLPYISYKTSRSGGKGGQNVNKVSTKVELNFDLDAVTLFSEEQKQLIREKLSARISSTGQIQVIAEETRSQLKNKEKSLEKLLILLQKALHKPKARKKVKVPKSVIENRLDSKRRQAMKKLDRGKVKW